MNAEQLLIDYFNKVADLAVSLEKDVKRDQVLSGQSVVLLSKVIAAGEKMQILIDTLTGTSVKYN